jgi:hypothetical protein
MKHDEILEEVLAEFKSRGYKVIHLNRKPIPDAIAIKNNKTAMIEVTGSDLKTKIYSKKLKYKQYGFETDDLVLIGKGVPNQYKIPAEAYYYALELRKKGWTYSTISEELEKRFKCKISTASICLWVKGTNKPLSIRNIEG